MTNINETVGWPEIVGASEPTSVCSWRLPTSAAEQIEAMHELMRLKVVLW